MKENITVTPFEHSPSFAQKLLQWYESYQRTLPWRTPYISSIAPQKTPLYSVWVSEIMLQQTGVSTAISYFQKFITAFPTVQDLANASEEEVLWYWQGLGYYSRGRNLHKAAKIIHGTLLSFPTTVKDWQRLPGIGPYSANAIIAIGEQLPAVALDTNIYRIMARCGGFNGPSWKKDAQEYGEKLMPEKYCGDYTQGLMDLAAMLCKAKNPLCHLCPVSAFCSGFQKGRPEDFPARLPAKIKPVRHSQVLVFLIEGSRGNPYYDKIFFTFIQKGERALLRGLWNFPMTQWTEEALGGNPENLKNLCPKFFAKKTESPFLKAPTYQGFVSHVFTHFRGIVHIWVISGVFSGTQEQFFLQNPDPALCQWICWQHFSSFPTSALMKKIYQKICLPRAI